MRSSTLVLRVLLTASLAACGGGNDVDPRVIPGGGVGDGDIDGEVNIHVIDADTDAAITTAMISLDSGFQGTVDANGLAVVTDVSDAQTIAVKATGYRSTVWAGVNGANVTIPLERLTASTPVDQATLSGSITGYDSFVPAGVKAALVMYTQVDDLGDPRNELATPNNANVCFGNTCAWSLVSRTGSLHVIAVIVDITDPNATPTNPDDDTWTVIGYASRAVTVEDGINQSGIALDLIQAGNLDNVTVDLGTPPASLTEHGVLVGIEIGEDEIAQLPVSFLSTSSTTLMPKLAAFPGSTYRLTAIAQTTAGDGGAQSIVLHRGQTATTLAAGTWLVPPIGVVATRTDASWEPVAGAVVHNVEWENATGEVVLAITAFDDAMRSVTVPALVALPASGALTARVGAIQATLDPTDFSLDEDEDTLTGISAQPVQIQ